jgi:general secretion pathway protein G
MESQSHYILCPTGGRAPSLPNRPYIAAGIAGKHFVLRQGQLVTRLTLAAPYPRGLQERRRAKRPVWGNSGLDMRDLLVSFRKETESPDEGFTLLELLVVIAILGLLIGLVAPAALRQLGGARVSVAHQSIERLSSVLDLYKLDVGLYPTTEQGLQALTERPADVQTWNGPYLKGEQSPLDPWNHPYVYSSPSTRSGRDYDLCSHGPSGNSTGQDMICNP